MSLSKRLRAAGYAGPHPLAAWKSDREWNAATAPARFAAPQPQVIDVRSTRDDPLRRPRLRRQPAGPYLPGFADDGPGDDGAAGPAPQRLEAERDAVWDGGRGSLPGLRKGDTDTDDEHEPLARAAIPGWVRVGRGFVTPKHMVPGPARDRVVAFLTETSR